MISTVLPPQATAAEAFADITGAALFPAEEAAMAGAAGQRRAEFATARACARAALARLGLPAGPIPRGPAGEPLWPDGVAGSITHCAGYRACAVAPRGALAALGIDAEPNIPLPGGLLDAVAGPAERGWLAANMAAAPQVCWDRLLFSARESAYKAWFSLTGRRLRAKDVAVVADPVGSRLTVRLLAPGQAGPVTPLAPAPAGPVRLPARLEGRWLAAGGLMVTAITIPA